MRKFSKRKKETAGENYRKTGKKIVGRATVHYSCEEDIAVPACWQTALWHRRSAGVCYTCHISVPVHKHTQCFTSMRLTQAMNQFTQCAQVTIPHTWLTCPHKSPSHLAHLPM